MTYFSLAIVCSPTENREGRTGSSFSSNTNIRSIHFDCCRCNYICEFGNRNSGAIFTALDDGYNEFHELGAGSRFFASFNFIFNWN